MLRVDLEKQIMGLGECERDEKKTYGVSSTGAEAVRVAGLVEGDLAGESDGERGSGGDERESKESSDDGFSVHGETELEQENESGSASESWGRPGRTDSTLLALRAFISNRVVDIADEIVGKLKRGSMCQVNGF